MSVRAFEKVVLSGDFFVMGGTVSEYHIISGTKMRGVGRFFHLDRSLSFLRRAFCMSFYGLDKKGLPTLTKRGSIGRATFIERTDTI